MTLSPIALPSEPDVPRRQSLPARRFPAWRAPTRRIARLLGLIVLLGGILAWLNPALALERAWLRDATGQGTLDEIRNRSFTPFTDILSRGFDGSAAYWLKLRVPATAPPGEPWVLRLHPGWHDDVRLFDPADPRLGMRVTGDRYRWSDSEFLSLSNAFVLPAAAEARDVFVRIQSVHSYQVDVELVKLSDAQKSEWHRLIALSIYVTAVGLVLLWALYSLVRQRDRTIAVFALTQAAAVLYSFLMFGLGRVLLDGVLASATLDRLQVLIVLVYALSSIWFYTMLMRTAGVRRWANILLSALSVLPVVSVAIYLTDRPNLALTLNSLVVTAYALAVFTAAWFGLRERDGAPALLPRWALRTFFSLIVLAGLLGSMPLLGWIQASHVSLLIFLIHGPLLTAVIGGLLIYRAHQRDLERARAMTLATTRIEQERLARFEQSQFIAMLQREVTNPLAVLKLLLTDQPIREKGEAQVDTVMFLLERCLQYDQLSMGQIQYAAEPMRPDRIVQQVIERTGMAARFVVRLAANREILSDAGLYGNIVSNLLDNALKYAATDSTISVDLEEAERAGVPCTCLTVSNTIGRTGAPDLERLFQKYYRADAARSIPGTGLGLYLVRSFATMLGGSVTCTINLATIRFEVAIPHQRHLAP